MKIVAFAFFLFASQALGINMMVDPVDLASSGPSLFVADLSSSIVWKVDTASQATIKFAGGAYGYSGDGGPATSAMLQNISAITASSDGSVYLCDGPRVRRVDASNIITTVVATAGGYGRTGDGGPATTATIGYCRGLATDAAGALYIADADFHVVRKVSSGIITTFAGNGGRGNSGDGGPAAAATLVTPYDVAVGSDGSVYVLDRFDHSVRRVSAAGTISTFAGSHVGGYADGPALAARFYYPSKIAFDAGGALLVLDSNNNRLRRVNAAGITTTVAGNGTAGVGGDGGPATAAQFLWPSSLATDSAGNVYIGNRSTAGQVWEKTNAVRQVDPSGTITTLIGYSNQPPPTTTNTAIPSTATRTPTSLPPTPTATTPPAGTVACDTWRSLGGQIGCAP